MGAASLPQPGDPEPRETIAASGSAHDSRWSQFTEPWRRLLESADAPRIMQGKNTFRRIPSGLQKTSDERCRRHEITEGDA